MNELDQWKTMNELDQWNAESSTQLMVYNLVP